MWNDVGSCFPSTLDSIHARFFFALLIQQPTTTTKTSTWYSILLNCNIFIYISCACVPHSRAHTHTRNHYYEGNSKQYTALFVRCVAASLSSTYSLLPDVFSALSKLHSVYMLWQCFVEWSILRSIHFTWKLTIAKNNNEIITLFSIITYQQPSPNTYFTS